MAWLRLTHLDGRRVIRNTDRISEISQRNGSIGTEIRADGTVMFYLESVEQIAGMIEQADSRELVLQVACAILSNEHSNVLTSEQVWARAVRFAMVDPEQPEALIEPGKG